MNTFKDSNHDMSKLLVYWQTNGKMMKNVFNPIKEEDFLTYTVFTRQHVTYTT